MKHTTKLGILLASAILSTTSFAFSSSKTFSKVIEPGMSYELPTDELYNGTYYQLSCTVFSSFSQQIGDSALKITSDRNIAASVDGGSQRVGTDLSLKFKPNGSHLEIAKLTHFTKISFISLDYSNNIHLGCIADIA